MKSHVGNVSQCYFLCFRKTITALAFSPDGKYLVTGEVSVRGERVHLVNRILKQGRGAQKKQAVFTQRSEFQCCLTVQWTC